MRVSFALPGWLKGLVLGPGHSAAADIPSGAGWLRDRLSLSRPVLHPALTPESRVQQARDAAARVLGRPAPDDLPFSVHDARFQHGLAWLQSVRDRPHAPVALTRMDLLNATRVSRVVDEGGNAWIFRRLPETSTAGMTDFLSEEASEIRNGRLTLAAARLNEALGLDTVPRARLVRVRTPEGRVFDGVRSEIAPGVPDARLQSDPQTLLRRLSRDDASNLSAFEYLVGNMDVHDGLNMHIDTHGRPRVFDHGLAFFPDLNRASRRRPIGTLLPEGGYTRAFLQQLTALTPERLRLMLGDVLAPPELDALIFRRAMILADAR